MATPNTAIFPAGKAPAVSDLAGGVNSEVFEATEWFIRMLGAWNFFNVHRQSAEPGSPDDWDIWLNPAVLVGSGLNQPDAAIYDPDTASFEAITKHRFGRAVVALGGGGGSGTAGASAYDIWLAEGNTGTEADFFSSLVGASGTDGSDGASAYDLWLAAGNTGTLDDFLASLLSPVGAILPFSGATPPVGYLLANGAELSRSSYAELFSVIGETWGAGNGSTTFALPDLRGRFLRCAGDVNPLGQYQDGSLMFSQSLLGWNPPIPGLPNAGAPVWSAVDRYRFFDHFDDANLQANVSLDSPPTTGVTISPDIMLGRVRPDNAAVNYIIKY